MTTMSRSKSTSGGFSSRPTWDLQNSGHPNCDVNVNDAPSSAKESSPRSSVANGTLPEYRDTNVSPNVN